MVANNKRTLALLGVLLICAMLLFGFGTAFASATTFSNVLDDLKNDGNFDETKFSFDATDYSLQVITIAESSEKELFVYVYQPSGQTSGVVATSINISTSESADIQPHNYKLQLLNSHDVLFKYRVKNFEVSSDETRYYGITSIYRNFDELLGDSQAEHGNMVSEVPYNVALEFSFAGTSHI